MNREICQISNWSFRFNLLVNLVAGDHVILKFPIKWNGPSFSTFTPLYTGYGSNVGTVIMIDHYTTDEIYFFIMVTTTLTASTTATITLNNFRNANDPSPGIVTNMIYWSRQGTAIKQKVSLYTFPMYQLYKKNLKN